MSNSYVKWEMINLADKIGTSRLSSLWYPNLCAITTGCERCWIQSPAFVTSRGFVKSRPGKQGRSYGTLSSSLILKKTIMASSIYPASILNSPKSNQFCLDWVPYMVFLLTTDVFKFKTNKDFDLLQITQNINVEICCNYKCWYLTDFTEICPPDYTCVF